jgi:hypothetical protein
LECLEEFQKEKFRRFQESTYIQHAVLQPAHGAVCKALKDGRLAKEPCSVCGTTEDVEGHHRDYTKPLEVQWFCQAHHMQEHVRMRRAGEVVIMPEIDRVKEEAWRLKMLARAEMNFRKSLQVTQEEKRK